MFALIAAVLVAVSTAPAAASDHCPAPDSGQAPTLRAEPQDGRFVFSGRGWGHGVGMSQYGAQGAALLGCTRAQILQHYYQGVTVEAVAPPGDGTIRVGIAPNAPSNQAGGSPVGSYSVQNTGSAELTWITGDETRTMPPGAVWRAEVTDGAFRVLETSGDTDRLVLDPQVGAEELRVSVSGDGRQVRLPNSRTYGRGELRLQSRAADRVAVTILLPMEQYLYGVREVPASWPAAAQEAQAVTARSYAYAARGGVATNCDCHLYDSVFSQVYHGTDPEPAGWVAAVDRSRREVLRRDGLTVSANYASSHGGHSESARFVWGGEVAYQQAVPDHAWEAASNNPFRTWTQVFTPEEAGQRLGVGVLVSLALPDPKGAAGRIGDPARGYGGVVAEGTESTRVLSGNQVRTLLGLRSTLFTVAGPPGIGRGDRAIPLALTWADGVTRPAWFSDGRWALSTPGGDILRITYGRAGDLPVPGDWNGDGQQTLGIVRDGTWHLRNDLSGGIADHSFVYGRVTQGDVPLVGNWDGRGGDTVGIVRDGTWHLRDELASGRSDRSFVYGRVTLGDLPLVGDWDGDGRDTVGIVRDGTWHLRDELASGRSDRQFDYGRVTRGDRPVVGDWNGDGVDTPGVVRGLIWHLRDDHSGGAAHRSFTFEG